MDRSIATQVIAENIRSAANSKGMGPEKLAEVTGYKPETMQKYYSGVRQPKAFMLYKIAKALGHSMDWFMMDVEEGAGVKPHGRLIDADKLESVIREGIAVQHRIKLNAADDKKALLAELAGATLEAVLKEIEQADTVMEAEK